jgi:hypothetical protein
MVLILLEALLALAILVAIVWWTMFSGRQKGELPTAARDAGAGETGAEQPPAGRP